MHRGTIAAVLAGALILGSTALADPQIPEGARALTEAEIKAAFDGKTFEFIAYDEPLTGISTWDSAKGVVSGSYVWEETTKGTYEAKWFIRDDRNCTQAPDKEPVCNTVYLDGNKIIEVTDKGVIHAVSTPAQ